MLKSQELAFPNSCLNRARDDEHIFILLQRDVAAATAIRAWAAERVRLRKNLRSDAQIISALDDALLYFLPSVEAKEGEARSSSFLLQKMGILTAEEIDIELYRAERHGARFASLHEAYAVLLEELDEVWDICRQKRSLRDPAALHKELVQLAAMAVRAIQSLQNFTGGLV